LDEPSIFVRADFTTPGWHSSRFLCYV